MHGVPIHDERAFWGHCTAPAKAKLHPFHATTIEANVQTRSELQGPSHKTSFLPWLTPVSLPELPWADSRDGVASGVESGRYLDCAMLTSSKLLKAVLVVTNSSAAYSSSNKFVPVSSPSFSSVVSPAEIGDAMLLIPFLSTRTMPPLTPCRCPSRALPYLPLGVDK